MTLKEELEHEKKLAEHRRGASATTASKQFNEGTAYGLKKALEIVEKHIGFSKLTP